MAKRQDERDGDRAMWQAARGALRGAAAVPGAAAPDEMDIAAYLEGRLEGRDRERLEAGMAGSEAALDVVLGARQSLASAPRPAPERVIRRASALVGYPSEEDSGGWLARLRSAVAPAWRPALSAIAAGLFLLVCAGSFELGRQESRSLVMFEAAPSDLDGPSLGLDDELL